MKHVLLCASAVGLISLVVFLSNDVVIMEKKGLPSDFDQEAPVIHIPVETSKSEVDLLKKSEVTVVKATDDAIASVLEKKKDLR